MRKELGETGRLTRDLEENLARLREVLGAGESFDVIVREFVIGGRRAALLFIDGFAKDDVLTNVLRPLLSAAREELTPVPLEAVLDRFLPYIEVDRARDLDEVVEAVLSGPLALLLDGSDEAALIDARQYPARSPEEPELERVLRGSRDGFVETLVFNTALIRRRVRDPDLRVELLSVGKRSRSDIAVIYIKDIANADLVAAVRGRIEEIRAEAVPMAEKTLEEYVLGARSWWNPFPLVRYTERPDVAAAHLFEGHVLVAVDTSPSLIILPTTFFHHLQHAEEYRENVVVGAYLRLVRFLGIAISWVGPPLWLAAALNRHVLPAWLQFVGPREPGNIPLALQFVMAEVGLDLIRLALIHVPTALGTALGFIGAIILGDIAAEVGLFATEVVLYVALAALGTFATPSLEFAMAVRLSRLFLLVLGGLFGFVGLGVGLAAQAALLLTTRSFRVPYMWPLVPFNAAALFGTIVRKPVPLRTVRPSILKTADPTLAQSGGLREESDEGHAGSDGAPGDGGGSRRNGGTGRGGGGR